MKPRVPFLILACCLGAAVMAAAPAARANPPAATTIPAASLLQPAEFAATLASRPAARPLILQVGFRQLFDQAHIPAAEYAGPGSQADGLAVLRMRVAKLPKDAAIVIYCGCCPWGDCPNIGAAFAQLRTLGFRDIKALYIPQDFGTDWVDKGYPVTRGR